MNLLRFFLHHQREVASLTLEHLFLVSVSTAAAIFIGIPLGILLTRKPFLTKPVLTIANVVQTIPSLALFGFLIPILGTHGIGYVPAIIALFLYALLPVIRNTYTGISGIDPAVRQVGIGMGMTDRQLLTQVELPLAANVMIAGVRTATVINVGTATIAAAIGAGGLGTYIFRGLRMNDDLLILAGAVPAALLALLADFLLGCVETSFSPEQQAKQRGKPRRFFTRRWIVASTACLAGILIFFSHATSVTNSPVKMKAIVIGSKDFTEQVILGELLAQVIESRTGLPVERKFELGGDLCHRFLVLGRIDAYVEYTGTAYTAILKHPPISNPQKVYQTVQQEYASRWNLIWLPPLGFNNTFAVLIRGKEARKLHLNKISDVFPYAPQWRAGFGQDFMSRQDGYPGLVRAYGLRFGAPPREMDLALTYRALAEGDIDLASGNSTDGMIQKLDLRQLQDDRHYFPPYQAAPVVRAELLARSPKIKEALESLAGKLSNDKMREMNYEVDEEHRDPKEVVKQFLKLVS